MKLIDKKGQGTVEYILLLLVVVSMISAVYSNDRFKDFFGKDSKLFTALKKRMEYSYRYCTSGLNENESGDNYADKHATYYNSETSETHFFAPKSKYPN